MSAIHDAVLLNSRHPAHSTLPELRRDAPFTARSSSEYKAYPDPPTEPPPYTPSAASSTSKDAYYPRPPRDAQKTPYLSSADSDSKLTTKKSLRRGLLKLSVLSAFRSKRDHPSDHAIPAKNDTTSSRS